MSLDTVRADRLGCYHYAAAQTPQIDALAAAGLRFEQATTVVPLTLPAHSSLMTGTFPGWHGVRDNGGFYLDDDQLTLAEILRDKGFRTGGFVGAFVLDRRWGIAQGFDRYFDDFDLDRFANAVGDGHDSAAGIRSRRSRARVAPGGAEAAVLRLGPPVRRAHAVRSAGTVPVALPAHAETAPTTPKSRTPTRRSAAWSTPFAPTAASTTRSSSSSPITARCSANTAS